MLHQPFYDPTKSYEDNYQDGPFGAFADDRVWKQTSQPTHSFLGHPVYLPFGIPAGPLLNSKFVQAAFKKGFDINVYKTVRTSSYPCHPHPNVLAVKSDGDLTLKKAAGQLVADDQYAEPLSITNSFGVPSMSPDVWQPDMAKAAQAAGKGQVMVGSFQGTQAASGDAQAYINDYVLAARLVKETGTKILEANLSCPNEGRADLLCFDLDRVPKIAAAIKEEIGNTPLLLKFAYYKDNEHLEKMMRAIGSIVDGVAAINTIPAQIVDKTGKPALPGKGRERSGVCGAAIKWAGLDMVKRLTSLRKKLGMSYAIVGVGGVLSTADYQEFVGLGADAVMSATGAMWNPGLAQEIGKGIQS